jgi:hypothetical protein
MFLSWNKSFTGCLTTFKDKHGMRDPATKAKSVMLTEEGAKRSRRLFEKHFMTE